MADEATTLAKLDELMTAIQGYDDPRRAGSEWKQVYRLLKNTDLPSGRATAVVGMRDVSGLAELIEQLRAPEASAAPADADVPDAATCKRALRGFRKRLTLTCLDDAAPANSKERGSGYRGEHASIKGEPCRGASREPLPR